MDPLEQLAKVLDSLNQHTARLAELQDQVGDEATRQRLASLAQAIQNGTSQLADQYPSQMAELDQRIARAQERAQKVIDQVEEQKTRLASAAPSGLDLKLPPPPPDEPIDPKLSQNVSRELLGHYGGVHAATYHRKEFDQDIWETWE